MAIMGIDLGTTYSVMATMEDGRVVVLSNVEGKQTTPSVVFFQDDSLDNVLVGDSAVFSAGTAPDRAVRGIKRQIGTDFVLQRGPGYTPEQVSAAILKKMKVDAESSLGEPVTDVVITIPAYFEAAEREATKKAGEMAGFKVRSLLAEPIAAAIDFAQTRGEDLTGKSVLVYDLGGGTFDVTVMRVSRPGGPGSPLSFDIVGKDGARTLGGLDWDRTLAEFVAREFVQTHPGKDPTDDPHSFDILLLQCQQAKEALSFKDPDGTVSVACTHDGVTHSVSVSRKKFEELTEGLLAQTTDKTSQLIARLGDKGITWQSIDYILLAGGSTKMPCTSAMLEQLSGKKPVTNRGVDFNVGRGAAYLAFSPDAWTDGTGITAEKKIEIINQGPRGDKRIQRPPADIANHSVGINVWDPGKNKDVNYILIRKDTPVNKRSKEEVFQTVEDNQDAVDIVINKGESEEVDQVERLGTVRISGLPPGPAGQQIKVWLCYNADGLITGEAVHAGSGKKAEIKVSLVKKSASEG